MALDALMAIDDIKEALSQYGTDITIRTITQGSYDPYTGTSENKIDKETKAFIKSFASINLNKQFSKDTYDLAITIYSENKITKTDKIHYNGQTYNISFINSKVLQNTTIIYELLVIR